MGHMGLDDVSLVFTLSNGFLEMYSPACSAGSNTRTTMTKAKSPSTSSALATVATALARRPTQAPQRRRPASAKNAVRKPKGVRGQSTFNATYAPAAMTTVIGSNPKASRQPFVVCKDEYSQDVLGSTGLSIITVGINPGLLGTFPWLYGQANSYQMYKFRRLRFNYYTRDSSGDKGTVALVFLPNPDDQTPTSLATLANYDTRVLTTPWQSAFVDVPSSDLNRLSKFLIRDALVASELSTYDVGFLCVAVGGTATGKLGELWITYELELFAPQPPDNLSIPPFPTGNAYFNQVAPLNTVAGTALTIPWDTPRVSPFGLYPSTGGTPGLFTGLRGALVVYAQMSITLISTCTGAGMYIQLSTDGGITYNNVIQAFYPLAGTIAGANLTANVETILQLLPNYVFRVVVITTGGTATIAAAGALADVLVLTPA